MPLSHLEPSHGLRWLPARLCVLRAVYGRSMSAGAARHVARAGRVKHISCWGQLCSANARPYLQHHHAASPAVMRYRRLSCTESEEVGDVRLVPADFSARQQESWRVQLSCRSASLVTPGSSPSFSSHMSCRLRSVGDGHVGSAVCSAVARTGDTTFLAGLSLEVAKPHPDRPKEGTLEVAVELTPLCSPHMRPGRRAPPHARHQPQSQPPLSQLIASSAPNSADRAPKLSGSRSASRPSCDPPERSTFRICVSGKGSLPGCFTLTSTA